MYAPSIDMKQTSRDVIKMDMKDHKVQTKSEIANTQGQHDYRMDD